MIFSLPFFMFKRMYIFCCCKMAVGQKCHIIKQLFSVPIDNSVCFAIWFDCNSKRHVKEEVTRRLELALDKLYRIWNEIGIDEGQVGNRAGTVSMHLCYLMDEMVSEEEQLRAQMARNIQQFEDDLSTLCLELALPVVTVWHWFEFCLMCSGYLSLGAFVVIKVYRVMSAVVWHLRACIYLAWL